MEYTNDSYKINSNLPIPINNKRFLSKLEMNNPRLVNNLKRFGKTAGYIMGGLGFATLSAATSFVSVPAVYTIGTIVGFTGTVGMFTKAAINTRFQNEKDLLFTAKKVYKVKDGKIDNELQLFQRADVINKVKGLNKSQLAGIIALNTVVGLERYKSLINTTKYSIEDGKKIYNQKFSTKTHSLIIKNLKVLEKMGCIKIDEILDNQGSNRLLIEKLTIGNVKGVKNYFKILLSGNKEQENKMQRISFRLTDKKIDILEMYKEYLQGNQNRITNLLFNEKMGGILNENLSNTRVYFGKIDSKNREVKQGLEATNKKITIKSPKKAKRKTKIGLEYDSLGRPFINYNAKESATEMFDKILNSSDNKQKLDFKENIRLDLSKEKQSEKIKEQKNEQVVKDMEKE